MSQAIREIPQGLTAVWSFAKTHTPSPLLSFLRKFKPPTQQRDIASQLQSLHCIKRSSELATQQLLSVDQALALRLAASKLHSTELIELKLHPPNEKAAARFDADAQALARQVKHARDTEGASTLGLAFAIWFQTVAHAGQDSQFVRQESYACIHEVFHALNAQGLLFNRSAIAICQSLVAAQPTRLRRSQVYGYLGLEGFLDRLLRASTEIQDVQILAGFADFLISQHDNYNDFCAIAFLKQLASFDKADEVIQVLARMWYRSIAPVPKLAPAFAEFRFPSGLSEATVRKWSQSRNQVDLAAHITDLISPCRNSDIPYLSPHAQLLADHAQKTLQELKHDQTATLKFEDYSQRWEHLLQEIAGIDLSHESVRERFVAIVSSTSHFKQLLRKSLRPKLTQRLAADRSDRANWVLAKLLEAAGKLSPETYSMCSTCLCSGYLFDREGRFCNRKTFRDFAEFIDRDIENLRAFIDPQLAANLDDATAGHVKRLMSFIRDFLIDPNNAHYTNFEIYRTKAFSNQ